MGNPSRVVLYRQHTCMELKSFPVVTFGMILNRKDLESFSFPQYSQSPPSLSASLSHSHANKHIHTDPSP